MWRIQSPCGLYLGFNGQLVERENALVLSDEMTAQLLSIYEDLYGYMAVLA